MKKIVILLFFCLSFVGSAQNEALFTKATTAYNEGDYEKAAEQYLKILENGEHSVAVYYNLGNTYYKMNKVAPSIYYYEKALLLNPNDTEIKSNLSYAQNMTLDAVEELPETGITKIYHKALALMSFDQWAYTAIICMFLFVLAYIAFYYMQYATQKRIAFISSLIALFLSICTAAMAYVQYADFNANQPAIVFSEEVSVKAEPNDRSSEAFKLHEGTKVNVLEELNNWKKVALADGKTGWLLNENIKLLKDF